MMAVCADHVSDKSEGAISLSRFRPLLSDFEDLVRFPDHN
jgi:hypothetical protein